MPGEIAGAQQVNFQIDWALDALESWLALEDPVAFLWSFVGGTPVINHFKDRSEVPAITPEAEAMSKALKKAGFTFVGPTICYAFMQASGMVMDHTQDCDRYAQLANGG